MSGMATYVLVHGGNISTETWNKRTIGDPVYTEDGTMGGKYWDGTVAALTAYNHLASALSGFMAGRCAGM